MTKRKGKLKTPQSWGKPRKGERAVHVQSMISRIPGFHRFEASHDSQKKGSVNGLTRSLGSSSVRKEKEEEESYMCSGNPQGKKGLRVVKPKLTTLSLGSNGFWSDCYQVKAEKKEKNHVHVRLCRKSQVYVRMSMGKDWAPQRKEKEICESTDLLQQKQGPTRSNNPPITKTSKLSQNLRQVGSEGGRNN